MSNDTKLLLEIKDPNITMDDSRPMYIDENNTIQAYGVLDYSPKACPHCGNCQTSKITCDGWRTVPVHMMSSISGRKIKLNLRKHNFHCHECEKRFLAQTPLVEKNCSIANNVRTACLYKLQDSVSMTHIADELAVSSNYVSRVLKSTERDLRPNLEWLPEVLLMDEIKFTDGDMIFEYMNAENHKLIDFVDGRSNFLVTKHFNHYTKEARNNVKLIVTDMNYTYPKLTQTVFPNALVIYDRFHITNALNRALNKTRIQVMKALPVSSLGYKQLKRYWKLLLMAPEKLNYKFYHRWTYFKDWLTTDGVVDELLAINPMLSATYTTLHQLLSAIKRRDWQAFKLNLEASNEVSELLKKSLAELEKNPEYIENALEYRYSNGPLEGTNNKLKVLIRNAYGFRNFNQYRLRALYTLKFRKKKKTTC